MKRHFSNFSGQLMMTASRFLDGLEGIWIEMGLVSVSNTESLRNMLRTSEYERANQLNDPRMLLVSLLVKFNLQFNEALQDSQMLSLCTSCEYIHSTWVGQ
jgi:hypothetical protein